MSDALMEIKSDIGELNGNFAGALREMSRIATALEQHLKDDREIHGVQDSRTADAIRGVSERVAVLEQAKAKSDGHRERSLFWAEAIRLAAVAVFAAAATALFTHFWH